MPPFGKPPTVISHDQTELLASNKVNFSLIFYNQWVTYLGIAKYNKLADYIFVFLYFFVYAKLKIVLFFRNQKNQKFFFLTVLKIILLF